ncbi:exopolyphosphatase [Roseivirga sp.]|uniref:Ppx/GppA phosphatase family protein n=1 Tax=Roseivirga sp. TaxID=1964215 RepID=UPI003B8E525E
MRKAVIDLGTNTFHLFIVEIMNGQLTTLYKEKIAVKIGQNGISKGKIAPDAIKRAIHALTTFKTIIDQFQVTNVKGVATSAIRNAKNGQALLDQVANETGITIEIISGYREAELIFEGVKAGLTLDNENQLIMDIGGGSVEFIIGNKNDVKWKRSFEIGAQRLLDKFHTVDPIPAQQIEELFIWLGTELKALKDAIDKFQPKGLIGCSGTFDTVLEIFLSANQSKRNSLATSFSLPIKAYHDIHRELLIKDKQERLLIPGMVTMRVDMIVVASCLISFVQEQLVINEIKVCSYALKEGLLFSSDSNN